MIPRLALILALLLPIASYAGTVTGQIQTPTGGAVANATLTFSLSQPAILSGTAMIASSTVSCYTSSTGNIVGLPDPLTTPIMSTNTSSGTLAAGTYYVKIAYTGTPGDSIASPEGTVTISAPGTVIVNAPTVQPASATGYKVYIGSTSGSETLQGTVTGWTNYSQSAALSAGAAPPATNASVCSIRFSDELIPTGTFYTVNLLSRSGAQFAGYPQTWCTYGGSGGTINVSSGAPTGNCGTSGVYYPTPVMSGVTTPQSVGGAFSAKSINGVFKADQYTAGDVSQKVNACIADVIANGGGTCDARGLSGAGTISQEIDVGNSASTAVVLLLPHEFTWQMSGITNGTSCGIKVFNDSAVIGSAPSGSSQARITAAATVNADSMVCSDPGSTANYVRVEGFMLYNTNGATFVHGLVNAQYLVDNSKFRMLTVANYAANGTGLRVYSACCGASFDDITANSNYTGGRPVYIQADASGFNSYISFSNLSAGHAGGTYPDVDVSGGNAAVNADAVNRDIVFSNLYTEFGTGVTKGLAISDARNIVVNGYSAGSTPGAAGSHGIDISQTLSNQVHSILIRGYNYQQGAGSVGLYNAITGESICGSTCYIPDYTFGGQSGSQPATASISVDNEKQWKNASGNTIFDFTMDGVFVERNWLDAGIAHYLDSGNTAAQYASFIFRDRGTNEWTLAKDPSNNFVLNDNVNSITRAQFNANSYTYLNSGAGSAPVRINSFANSGTGGLEVWSGGASPAAVATVSGAGAAAFNGGVKAGSSGSTIADTRELIQSAHSCGTTATCANTANGQNRMIFGTVALTSGTPSTATVTGISPAFTSTTSYVCVVTNQTTQANPLKVSNVSTSSFTITGPNTVTDTVGYQCIGN